MYQKEFVYKEFLRKEENILRAPYNPELEFYSVIKSGNIEKTKELCKEEFVKKGGLGVLSNNLIQNMRYHYAITIALVARYCIEGGMDVSTSYALSDFYIQKVDLCKSLEEINELHRVSILDYATRMHKLRKDKICSIHVIKCIEYMNEHLHTKIKLTDLAEHVKLNSSYLSRLFKEETGVSINEYIRQMKIDAAKNMLIYSDFSASQIASILAFSDQSYFTEVFHKQVGLTPKQYKDMHYREIDFAVDKLQ